MSSLREFDHLRIQLADIIAATNNFAPDKFIGRGGFGPVYRGELVLSQGPAMVAFKRLDSRFGQGNIEFWKEIMMLSKYKHENLVTLMHFCIERDEMILVYEYASRGSLDQYIGKSSLTWIQRLKICIGVARALRYLHDPYQGGYQRVIHRDIKSSNVLLYDNWTAKVSDFGLAKVGPANQLQTHVFTGGVGTPGYWDPVYLETGYLTKESDVYSFGVVLFEILCGRPCYEYKDKIPTFFVSGWRNYYEKDELHEHIFKDLKEQAEPGSLSTFSAIAYRCVKRAREERPKMDEIVQKLELALQQQEVFESLKNKADFEEMRRIAKLGHVHEGFNSQLLILFLNGILVDDKTLISINNNGEFIELVSGTTCISGEELVCEPNDNSRFPYTLWGWPYRPFEVDVSTHFLSPNVKYTVNLIFKHCGIDRTINIIFRHKLNHETQYLTSSSVVPREDGWLMTELFQFTSNQKQHTFRIEFLESFDIHATCNLIFLQGVEFRPVEVVG